MRDDQAVFPNVNR